MKIVYAFIFCAIVGIYLANGSMAADNGQTILAERQNIYDQNIKDSQTARDLLIFISAGCVGHASNMKSNPAELPEELINKEANVCVGSVAKAMRGEMETEFKRFNANPSLEILLYRIALRSLFWGYEAKANNEINNDQSLMKCVTAVINSSIREWLRY